MPIGKNAIKRVENNGYSKVKSDAPDMENSVVAEKETTPVVEAVPVKAVKTAAKKPAAKKAPAAKPAAKKACGKCGFVKVQIGGEMPYYLL